MAFSIKALIFVPTVSLAAFAFALPASAQTQDEASLPDNDDELSIGAGAGIMPTYPGSDDYRVIPAAVVRGRYKGFTFFTRGTSVYLDAIPDDPSGFDFEAGPFAAVRMDRNGGIKDERIKALGKLDKAWEVGGWVGLAKTGVFTSDYDNLSARISYQHDVSGAHDSYMITSAIEYGTPLSKANYVGGSVSLDYVGKGFGRYYYDITPAGGLASGLGAYGGAGSKAGFAKTSVTIIGIQSLSGDLNKGWAVLVLGSYSRMLGRYADSPIVRDAGNRNQWIGGVGIGYTF